MASYFLFLDNINDNHGEASKELGKIGGRLNDNYSSKNTTKGKLQPYKLLHERLVRKIAAIKRGYTIVEVKSVGTFPVSSFNNFQGSSTSAQN